MMTLRKEEEQIPDSVSLLATLNIKYNNSHIHNQSQVSFLALPIVN
jgi:hypothetical protein